jgi:hypothetical protein
MPLDDKVAQSESVVGRNRVAVFPVAAFGWHESPLEEFAKLGDLQAAHRCLTEHSFGVLDPVLWMLHQLSVYRLPAR